MQILKQAHNFIAMNAKMQPDNAKIFFCTRLIRIIIGIVRDKKMTSIHINLAALSLARHDSWHGSQCQTVRRRVSIDIGHGTN
jgi:hypothetical protein